MTPLVARLTVTLVAFAILLVAAMVLWILDLREPAIAISGMLLPLFVILSDQLKGANDLRRSGYHTPITPKREPERDTTEPEIETDPPPARRRMRVEAVIPPPLPDAKRDPTPMTERILELAGGRRYAEARGLAHQYRRPDLVSRVDALERAEKAERRAEDDTNGRIRRGPR